MKTAWIAFEKDSGFSAWLVRSVSGYPFNHVLVVYPSEDWQSLWATEAVSKGVRAMPLRSTRKFPLIFKVKYDMTPDLLEAQEYIGERYDLAGLIIFGCFILAWRWFKAKIKMPHVTFKGQMCSEYVARVLGNRYKMQFAEPQWTKPEDIAKFCENKTEDFAKVEAFN